MRRRRSRSRRLAVYSGFELRSEPSRVIPARAILSSVAPDLPGQASRLGTNEELMTSLNADRAFAGSIPALYERYLVPLIFEPYAEDLALRVALRQPSRILEVAAGTGVVTRRLASALPASASIVASDLNQPMLDQAAARGTARPVEWRQADAMQLPFADRSFDVVVCQFGAMFFPDKARAYSEARRVLDRGGLFLFSVWDRLETNEFTQTVIDALGGLFPADPPRFLARVPHGYYDRGAIARDLAGGGFSEAAEFTIVSQRSRADSARVPALAFCHGTPLRGEIEQRGSLEQATDRAEEALVNRFGSGPVEGGIQALVVSVEKE